MNMLSSNEKSSVGYYHNETPYWDLWPRKGIINYHKKYGEAQLI